MTDVIGQLQRSVKIYVEKSFIGSAPGPPVGSTIYSSHLDVESLKGGLVLLHSRCHHVHVAESDLDRFLGKNRHIFLPSVLTKLSLVVKA